MKNSVDEKIDAIRNKRNEARVWKVSNPARVIFLTLALAISAGAIFYALTYTATFSTSLRPFIATFGIIVLVMLLLHGIIDPKGANSGFWPSVVSLLPRLFDWGESSVVRTLIVSGFSVAIASSFLWLGPFGVKSLTIVCSGATEIKLLSHDKFFDCSNLVKKSIWQNPLERRNKIAFTCRDVQFNEWKVDADIEHSINCGMRPINAKYVTNGIYREPGRLITTTVEKRTEAGINRLRAGLILESLPDRSASDTFLFATWNIRRNTGSERLEESFAYIAEIISHFDIVAIQEISDLSDIDKILSYLNGNYKAEFSFIAPGPTGNQERLGFIYDARKITPGKLSTTLVISNAVLQETQTGQPARPPFLMEFIINGRSVNITNSHILFGRSSGEKFKQRVNEIAATGTELSAAQKRHFPKTPLIWAGDLNVSSPNGEEVEAIIKSGFYAPEALLHLPTNMKGDRPYDQILVSSLDVDKLTFGHFGAFYPFEYVFREEDSESYKIDFERNRKNKSRKRDHTKDFPYRRTFQLSDHRIKWAEFRVDW